MLRDYVKVALVFFGVVFLMSSIPALMSGSLDTNRGDGCRYNSVAKLHPMYFASCEFFKVRWKTPPNESN